MINFLSDIQPNDDERDFLLTYLSHALYGNMLEWFTILTGVGRNGKSKFIELIKKTFGEFLVLLKVKCSRDHNQMQIHLILVY